MSINVLASTIVLASTSYVQPVFDLSYAQPVAQVSYVDVQTQASYLDIQVTVELTTPGRIEVDVITPADLVTLQPHKRFAETIPGLLDFARKTIGKGSTESLTFSDSITRKAVVKALADIQNISEQKQISFAKALVEVGSLVDVASLSSVKQLAELLDTSTELAAKQFTKVLEDSVALSDVPYLLLDQLKADAIANTDNTVLSSELASSSDNTTTDDELRFASGKGLSDTVAFLETVTIVAQKFFSEFFSELVTTTEAQILDITSQKADNMTMASNGLLVMQDYCDITYFLEDYVGQSRTFT